MAAKAQTLTAELWGGSNEDILKAKDLMMCAVRLIGINIVFFKIHHHHHNGVFLLEFNP